MTLLFFKNLPIRPSYQQTYIVEQTSLKQAHVAVWTVYFQKQNVVFIERIKQNISTTMKMLDEWDGSQLRRTLSNVQDKFTFFKANIF